jgi:hypothetical protein
VRRNRARALGLWKHRASTPDPAQPAKYVRVATDDGFQADAQQLPLLSIATPATSYIVVAFVRLEVQPADTEQTEMLPITYRLQKRCHIRSRSRCCYHRRPP